MTETNDRALPVGIQSFYEIREKGFLYVDKTDLIWELTHRGKKKYHYLSRPRRFGKSVLVDTLQAYFEGEKRLFEGLKIMDLKNYWAASGATSLLPKFVGDMELRLDYFDHCYIDRDTLETSDVSDGGAELFLYQSGYLTIKEYEEGVYTLGFPNYEVRKALYKIVIPCTVQG